MSDINNLLLSETEGATPAEHLEARNRGGWIAVKDRLPENDTCVLIAVHEYDDPNNKLVVTYAEFFDGQWLMQDGHPAYDPVYWQPLPEPPKD